MFSRSGLSPLPTQMWTVLWGAASIVPGPLQTPSSPARILHPMKSSAFRAPDTIWWYMKARLVATWSSGLSPLSIS